MSDWRDIHSLFLSIGENLMAIGTKRNMTQDWYKMVEKKIDHGVDIAYRNLTPESSRGATKGGCSHCEGWHKDGNPCGGCGALPPAHS